MAQFETDDIYSQTNKGKDIFEHYLGHEIELNKRYNSVFREEKNPSMAFYTSRDDGWRVKDFGLGNNIGPIEFVMELFGLDFPPAKRKIIADLKLATPQYKQKYSNAPIKPVLKETIREAKQDKFKISYTVMDFPDEDLSWWYKFWIELEELNTFDVFAAEAYYLEFLDKTRKNAFIKRSKENKMISAFKMKDIFSRERTKMYCPLVTNPDFKWVGDSTRETVQGISQLKYKSKNLCILSGLKDIMALTAMQRRLKVDLDVELIAGNSESSQIPNEILIDLKSRYENTFSLLDWDKTGKRWSDIYEAHHRIRPLNSNLRDYNVKDVAEMPEYCEQDEIEEFLNNLKSGML